MWIYTKDACLHTICHHSAMSLLSISTARLFFYLLSFSQYHALFVCGVWLTAPRWSCRLNPDTHRWLREWSHRSLLTWLNTHTSHASSVWEAEKNVARKEKVLPDATLANDLLRRQGFQKYVKSPRRWRKMWAGDWWLSGSGYGRLRKRIQIPASPSWHCWVLIRKKKSP